MPSVHMLSLTSVGKSHYWVHPTELPEDYFSPPSLVIPIKSSRSSRWASSYEAHISRVDSAGSLSYVGPIQLNLVSPRRYRVDLGDGVFLHYVYKKWVVSREYGGHLYHPDFIHRLIELQAEDPEAEEEILTKQGILILGTPISKYKKEPSQAPWSKLRDFH